MIDSIKPQTLLGLLNRVNAVSKTPKTDLDSGRVVDGVSFGSSATHFENYKSTDAKNFILVGPSGVVSKEVVLEDSEDYVRLPDFLINTQLSLFGWVHKDLKQVSGNRRVVLFADALVVWAFTLQKDAVVVGFACINGATHTYLVVVENGRLKTLEERMIMGDASVQATSAHRDFLAFLDRVAARFSKMDHHLCGTDVFDVSGWKFSDVKPFLKRRSRPTGAATNTHIGKLAPLAVPLVCALVGIAGLLLYLYPKYQGYEQAKQLFLRESQVVQGGAEYAPSEVDMLQNRQKFLVEAAKPKFKLASVSTYVDAINSAIPGEARMLDLKVNLIQTAAYRPGEWADLNATVMLPIDERMQALDQIQPVLEKIGTRSGWKTRVRTTGWREEKIRTRGLEKTWRIFLIEVEIPQAGKEIK